MRTVLDAIFKYVAWALYILVALMIETRVSSSANRELIRLSVVLLAGLVVIDILFGAVGVFRRGSKKHIKQRAEKRTEKRILSGIRGEKWNELPSGISKLLLGRRKDEQQESTGPVIIFPPVGGADTDSGCDIGGEQEQEEQMKGTGLRDRLRSMISAWLPDDGEDDSGDI